MPLDASILLSSPDALRAVVEALPRRSASRFARTSHGFLEPGLGAVWRELDSLVPLVALFPTHIFKKAKRPGMGLASMPSQADWTRVLAYAPLVRALTYDESARAAHPSLFPVLASSPGGTLLPRLRALTWRAETAAGLGRAAPFLGSAHLHALALTLGPKAVPQLAELLTTPEAEALHLAVFDLVAAAPVPTTVLEAVPDIFAGLERLSLSMPELFSPAMGLWIARLPYLRALELDLAGASIQDLKGFFMDMPGLRSRGSVHSSPTMNSDSGVFSGEEDNAPAGPGALPRVQTLKLRGAARAIAEFLKHLAPGGIAKLQLTLADPPEPADWADVLELLGCCFGASLTSFTVGAAESIVDSSNRPPRRLCLDALARVYLPALTSFCIDMCCASMITDTDLYHLARACPALHKLYLPLTPPNPRATLDGLAFLTARCPSLYSISLSLDAQQPPSDGVFFDLSASSRALRVLDVGNSCAGDSLQAAVALSHLAPHLETLRYAEADEGQDDTDEKAWSECARILPALQGVRLTERWIAMSYMPEARDMCEQWVETEEVEEVVRRTLDYGVQVTPEVVEQGVLAVEEVPKREMAEVAIDATGPPPTPKVVRFSPTNDYFDLEDHQEEDELDAEEREWEELEASTIEIKAIKDERDVDALEPPVVEIEPPTPIQCAEDRNGSPIFSFDDIATCAEDMQHGNDSGEDSSVTEEIVFNVDPMPLPPPQVVDIFIEGSSVEDDSEVQRPTIDLVAVDTEDREAKKSEDTTPEDETLPTEYSTPITESQDDAAPRGAHEEVVSPELDAQEFQFAPFNEDEEEEEAPLITRETSESPILDALEASEEIDAPPPRDDVQTPPPPYALTHADSEGSSRSGGRTGQHQQHTAMLDAPTPPTQLYIPHVVSRSVDLAWKIAFFGPTFMTARMHDIWALSPLGPGSTRWLQGEKGQNHSRQREGEMEVMDIGDEEGEERGGSAMMRRGISPVCM
ncbi:hypothetical protein PENSPDRAFT_647698 [Peniophora sp. CONT]|nr:hypothetical protein PENSPDRAFT_647698 [Peniophora sp. CONT]